MQGREPSERERRAIDECLEGRLEGLEHLYEIYRVAVFRTCLRLLGDLPAAEDAAQEVFLRVFERIATFNGRAAFSTWLYRLTVNHCLNVLARLQRRATLAVEDMQEPVDPSPEPECAYRRAESEGMLVRVLGALSVEHRTILVLREIEELSYREIAAVLDVPAGTVMSRLARARDALRIVWTTETGSPWNRRAKDPATESTEATRSRQERP